MITVLEDPWLPHQIVITQSSGAINVSCNCLARHHLRPIASKTLWRPGEAIEAWRTFHGEHRDD